MHSALGGGLGSALGSRWRRVALAVLAVALSGAAHSRMETPTRVERGEGFIPSPEQARLSSLGFDALVADYFWLAAVQLVGGSGGETGEKTPLVASLIELVTALDPWVDHPYRFAAVWLTDSPESVLRANRLLERGISYHPREWRNRHYLGFNHFFYLGDDEAAAEVLEPAVHLDGAPSWLGGLVARLRSDADGLETAAALLENFAESAVDEYARAAYLKSLDEVRTERAARYLDAARIEYWKRNGRDIERVEDLLAGARPVLRVLPRPHPHFSGFHWQLDENGQIVSSFYGSRYQLHLHDRDDARRRRWRAQVGGGERG